MLFRRRSANEFAVGRASPLSRATRFAQHKRHRRGGGAGGGGTSSCRPREGTRTVSPSTTRPLIRPSGTLYLSKGVQDSFPPEEQALLGGGRIGEGTSRPDRLWALAPVLACRVGFGQRSQTANCGCRSSTRDQAACRAGGRKVLPRAGQTRPASIRLTRWGDAAIAWGAPDWSCFGGPVTRWSGASLNP